MCSPFGFSSPLNTLTRLQAKDRTHKLDEDIYCNKELTWISALELFSGINHGWFAMAVNHRHCTWSAISNFKIEAVENCSTSRISSWTVAFVGLLLYFEQNRITSFSVWYKLSKEKSLLFWMFTAILSKNKQFVHVWESVPKCAEYFPSNSRPVIVYNEFYTSTGRKYEHCSVYEIWRESCGKILLVVLSPWILII